MNFRYVHDFVLPRLLVMIALISGAVFTGNRIVRGATFNEPCNIDQLNADLNTANNNNQNETINLAANCTYTLTAQVPVLTIGADTGHGLTINGNGAVFNGAGTFRGFNVAPGATLSLDNISIRDGRTINNGGAIFNQGTLTITNSTLSNNLAGHNGGAIYNASGATLNILSSTLSANVSASSDTFGTGGGAIYNENSATLNITSSTLSANQATGYYANGGGIFNAGTLTVTRSTLSGNAKTSNDLSGSDGGGAIYNYLAGNLTVENSTLANNIATYGGAIYDRGNSLIVRASTLSGNSAVTTNNNSSGGAIWIDGPEGLDFPGGEVSVSASTLSSNSADYGAAIYYAGNRNDSGLPSNRTLQVTNSNLFDNSARYGGAIYNHAPLNINNSKLSHNLASVDGGAIYNYQSVVTLLNSTLGDNTASNGGGGIYNSQNANLSLSRSTLSGNSANYGGGIFTDGISATVDESTLSGNKAQHLTIDAKGGGIYNNGGTLYVVHSTLSGNVSNNGGSIYNNSTLTLTASTLSDSAGGNGGGLYNNTTATANIANSTFSGNSAVKGGGILNFGAVNTTASTLSFNFADGGGIYNSAGTITIRSVLIAGNIATTGSNAPDIRGQITSQGYNLIGNSSGSVGLSNTVNNDKVGTAASPINPLTSILADNGGATKTISLLAGSPAINAIPAANCAVNNDQRGVLRPKGEGCDIGAFELDNLAPTNEAPTPTNTATAMPTSTRTPSPTIAVPTNTPQVPETPVPTPWGPPPRDDS